MLEPIECPDAGRWRRLLDGSMPEEEKTELDRHLEVCERCQQTVDSLVADQASWCDMARHLSDARPEIESAQNRTRYAHRDPRAPDTALDIPEDDGDPLSFLQPSQKPASLGRLGHYEILEILGRGGMGIVLRAFDDKLHRVVAIKVMTPALAATSPPRKRFLREARAAARVRHEHIIDIHAVEEEPIPYLVMEYVPGENLQQKLDRVGPLEVPEVLRIGAQIARGLAAAHVQGLSHRDIKPANILLQSGVDQVVKITDFGLARAADDASLTQSGMIAGTPMYMAPEQAQGETTDHRADLFSLGSVLYTMCTGRPPFRASTSLAVLKRVAEDTPRPIREVIPEVPPWLCDIIARLQAKKAEDRYQTAQEVADLLTRADLQHQGQGLSVGQPARVPETAFFDARQPTPSVSWTRGRRRLGWAAALALLLLGGLSLTEATGVTNVRATVIRIFTGDGTLIVEVNDSGVKVAIEGDGGLVITGAGPQEVRLRPGSYKVQATKNGKRVQLDRELVTITRGGKQAVRVRVESGNPAVAAPKEHPTFVTPWREGGDWVVKGQEVHQLNDRLDLGHHVLFGDPDWTDYDFEAEVEIIGGKYNETALIFRATNPSKFLYAALGAFYNTRHSVLARHEGGAGEIGSAEGQSEKNRWYRLRAQARGNRCKIFLDGKLLTSVYSDQYPRGCVGLLTIARARFRNLKVTDPSGKILFEGVQNILPKQKGVKGPTSLKPETADSAFHLGDFNAQTGQWDKARAAFDRGLQLDTDQPSLRRGSCYDEAFFRPSPAGTA